MELLEKQVDYVNRLLKDYEGMYAGGEFISELIYIADLALDKDLEFKITKSVQCPVFTDVKTQTMYYNPPRFPSYLKSKIKLFKKIYPEIDEIALYNYFVVEGVLHEISHVEQGNMSYNYSYTHEEIARLYRLLFDALDKKSIGKLLYSIKPTKFFHERNAEIQANLAAAQIYRDTELSNVATNLYVASLFNGYGDYGECPVKTSLNYIKLPYGVDLRGISFRDAFYHGTSIDIDKYNAMIDFLGDKTIEELDALEIDQKIRSLG